MIFEIFRYAIEIIAPFWWLVLIFWVIGLYMGYQKNKRQIQSRVSKRKKR